MMRYKLVHFYAFSAEKQRWHFNTTSEWRTYVCKTFPFRVILCLCNWLCLAFFLLGSYFSWRNLLVLFLKHCCGSIQDDGYRKEKLSPLCCLSHSRGLNSWQQTWVNGSNIIFSCAFSCSVCTVFILLHFLHYIAFMHWYHLLKTTGFFQVIKSCWLSQRQSNWHSLYQTIQMVGNYNIFCIYKELVLQRVL